MHRVRLPEVKSPVDTVFDGALPTERAGIYWHYIFRLGLQDYGWSSGLIMIKKSEPRISEIAG